MPEEYDNVIAVVICSIVVVGRYYYYILGGFNYSSTVEGPGMRNPIRSFARRTYFARRCISIKHDDDIHQATFPLA
jgi:hypothetical protein